LNPDRQRSLENQIRLSGYRKSLERLMLLQRQGNSRDNNLDILEQNPAEIRALRSQYSITPQEESWILSGITPEEGNLRRAEFLLTQLPPLIDCYRALHQPILRQHDAVLSLLRDSIHHKKELIVRTILEILETLHNEPAAINIAQQLRDLAPIVLEELLNQNWQTRLSSEVLQVLTVLPESSNTCSLDYSVARILSSLDPLLDDRNPLIQIASLYLIAQLNLEQSQAIARNNSHNQHPLWQETSKILLSLSETNFSLTTFPKLEKAVHLFNSDFFNRIHSETLIGLAERAEVRSYSANEVITEAGDTCRELLLLIEGEARIQYYLQNQEIQVEKLHPGQTLDELEVLAHSESQNT
ncbi:MAG: cyclic nucleotide-binding domain-containing protein, partial [Waterburya sp.]